MSLDLLLNPTPGLDKAIIQSGDANNLFRDATWDSIKTNGELRSFLQGALDPDGSKYGGDIEALKTDLLNEGTKRGSSMVLSAIDALGARSEGLRARQFENLVGRLYESAPNRLVSGDANQTYEAVKSGLIGAVGYDAPINLLLAPLSVGKQVLGTVGKSLLTREATGLAVKEAASTGGGVLAADAANALSRSAMVDVAKQGAMREAGVGALTGGIGDAFQQDAQVSRGLRDEYSLADSAVNIAGGGILGGAIGGLTGAYQGRGLAKELLTGNGKEMAGAGVPEGSRSIPDLIGKEQAGVGPTPRPAGYAGDADALQATLADSYAAIKSNLDADGDSVGRLRREVTAGYMQSQYTPEQLAAIESAMTRISDVQNLAEAELRFSRQLLAGESPTPDAVERATMARANATKYQNFAQRLTSNPDLLDDIISNGDVNPAFVRLLATVDDKLAEALNPAAATPPAGKAGKAAAAPTATAAAPKAAAAPAAAPTAAPAAPPAAAAPAAPTTATAAAPEAPAASQAPAAPSKITADEVATVATTSDQAMAAVATDAASIKDVAAKLNQDAGQLVESLRSMTPEAATKFEADNGIEAGIKEKAENIAKAVEMKRQADVDAAAKEAPPAQEAPAQQPLVDEDGGAPAAMTEAEADPVVEQLNKAADAHDKAQEKMVGAIGFHQSVMTRMDGVVTDASKVMDDILAAVEDAAKGDKADMTPAQVKEQRVGLADSKLAAKIAEIEKTNPLLADALSLLKGSQLQSAAGVAKAKKVIELAAQKAVAWQYANAITKLMPQSHNVAHFAQIIDVLPDTIPDTQKAFIKAEFNDMVRQAMAARIEMVGYEQAAREFGKQMTVLGVVTSDPIAGAKVGLNLKGLKEIVKGEIDELTQAGVNLSEKERAVVLRAGRSMVTQLKSAGVYMDEKALTEAVRMRVNRTASEILSGSFQENNAGDYKQLEAMIADRKRGIHPWNVGGNPVIQWRQDGGMDLISGSVESIKKDGTKSYRHQGILTDGTSINGHQGMLWAIPRNQYGAEVATRKQMSKASVDRASNKKSSDVINGKKVSGTQKEVAGLRAEVQQQLVDRIRMESIMEQAEKLEAGTITQDQFDALMSKIYKGGRVDANAVEAAKSIATSRKWMADNLADAQRQTNKLLNSIKEDGRIDAAEIVKLIGKVQDVYARHQDDLFTASKNLKTKAEERIAAGKKPGPKGEAEVKANAKDAPSKATKEHVRSTKEGAVEFGRRDNDSVAVVKLPELDDKGNLTGKQRKVTLSARDVFIFGSKGDIRIGAEGRPIGSWSASPDTGRVTLRINGMESAVATDMTSVLNRGSFQTLYADDLRALALGKGAKVDDAVPEGAVLDKAVSGHTEAVAAHQSVVSGKNWTLETLLSELASKAKEGEQLAIRFRTTGVYSSDNPGRIQRVTNDAMKLHKTIGEFLNGKVKDPNADIEVGFTTMAAKQNGAPPSWRALDGEQSSAMKSAIKRSVERGDIDAVIYKKSRVGPLSMEDASKVKVGNITMDVAWKNLTAEMLGVQWQNVKNIVAFDAMIDSFAGRVDAITAFAPYGIRMNNARRRTTFSNLSNHLGKHSRAELEQALRMLRSLDAEVGGLPYFYEDNTLSGGAYSTAERDVNGKGRMARVIEMNAADKPNPKVDGSRAADFPAHFTVSHEVGHWAFSNILSPAEQLEFLQSMRKHYKADGTLDVESVRRSMSNMAAMEKGLGVRFKGADATINELFAWQWTNHQINKISGSVDAEMPLWSRFVKYTKNIIAAMLGEKPDPDLVHLFDRIMPSMEGEKRYAYEAAGDMRTGAVLDRAAIAGDEKRKVALQLMDSMEKIDELRARLNSAVLNYNSPIDANAKKLIEEATDFMFGAIMGTREPRPSSKNSLRRKMNTIRVVGKHQYEMDGAVKFSELYSKEGFGPLKTKLKEMDAALTDAQAETVAARIIESDAGFAYEFDLIDRSMEANPEAKTEFNRTLEREVMARLKKGMTDDEVETAYDMAEEAAYAAVRDLLGGRDVRDISGFDHMMSTTVATPAQANAVRALGERLSDMMSDALDHYVTRIQRSDIAIPSSRRVAQRTPVTPEKQPIADEATKVAAKRKAPKKQKKAETAGQQRAADAAQQAEVQAAGGQPADGMDAATGSVASRITHRDEDVQADLQNVANALFNTLFDDGQMTNRNMDILMFGKAGDDADYAVVNPSLSPAFIEFRRVLRIIGNGISSRDGAAVEYLSRMVARVKLHDMVDADAGMDALGAVASGNRMQLVQSIDNLNAALSKASAEYQQEFSKLKGIDQATKKKLYDEISDQATYLKGKENEARAEYDSAVAELADFDQNKPSLNTMVKSMKYVFGDINTRLSDAPDIVQEAVGDVLAALEQFKNADVSKSVSRALGDAETSPTIKVPAGRYLSGGMPAEIAMPVVTRSIKTMTEAMHRAILGLVDSVPTQGDNTAEALGKAVAWRHIATGKVYATAEDALDKIGATYSTNGALARAIVDEDAAALHALISAREAENNVAGLSDAIEPVIVNMEKLHDTAVSGKAPAVKALKEAGLVGWTDGTEIKLNGNKVMTLEEAISKANKTVSNPRTPDAPVSSEFALYLMMEEALPNPLAVEQRTIFTGAPATIGRVAGDMFRSKKPTDLDGVFSKVRTWHGPQIAENSVRIAKAGAQWLANLVKPVEGVGFDDVLKVSMGRSLLPLIDSIDKLVGIDGTFKKTLNGIYSNLSMSSKGMPQSNIEEAITLAIRKGDIMSLPKDQREVAMAITKHMQSELRMMREAGLPVGDLGPNYLPQRFNTAWIQSNPDKAVELLAKWMERDSPGNAAGVRQRAQKVINEALNREELQGILDSSSNVYTQAFGDKLYSRKLHVAGADWDELAPLFDQNLKSLLISYTEAAHKRVEWSKRFGIRGHAANTYIEIGRGGEVAAAEALKSRAVGMKEMATGGAKEVGFAEGLFNPLARDDYEASVLYGDIIRRLRLEGDTKQAREEITKELIDLHAARGGFGADHFRKHAEAIVNGVGDFLVRDLRVSEGELNFMAKMVGVLGGRPAHTIPANNGLRNAAGYMRTFNSVTLLSASVISSLPDLGLPLARSGQFSSWLKGMAGSLKLAMGDEAYRAGVLRLGVGIDSVLNENMFHLQGSKSGRISNAFFLANGLTQWTNATRQMAALVGYESIKANQAIVQREKANGYVGSAKYQRALRYLRQLGLAELADAPPISGFAEATEDLKVSQAIHRFVNESVFQPSRNDVPLWAQDPIAGLMWQFKSYPVMMGRLVKRTLQEATAMENGQYVGDPAGLAYLATIGVGLGIGTVAAKDVIMGRNEEAGDGNWRSVRDRTFSKVAQEFGMKDYQMSDSEKDKFLGWYVEGVLQMGALGFVGDLMYQTASKIDNGSFGKERIYSQVMGPWLGTVGDAIDIIGGAANAATVGDEDGNAKERVAARKVINRVPFVGRNNVAAEGWTDWIAGEAQAK